MSLASSLFSHTSIPVDFPGGRLVRQQNSSDSPESTEDAESMEQGVDLVSLRRVRFSAGNR